MSKRVDLKKTAWALLLIALPAVGRAQQDTVPKLVLDLDKAIEIALSSNPTIKVADQEVTRRDYSRKEAIGALFPTIDLSGQYTRNVKKQVMYMDMPATDQTGGNTGGETGSGEGSGSGTQPEENAGGSAGGFLPGDPDEGFSFGRNNQWSVGFSFQLPIIAPSLWANIKLTRTDVEKSLELARSSRLDMINQVQRAYYNILLSEDSYEVLKQSYENAQLNAEDFRNKFKQGMASEYDVLRAEVQVRNQEPGLLQAENAVNLTRMQLKVLLGLDMNIPIELASKLSDYEQEMYETTLNIDTSLQHNTTLRQLDLDLELLKRSAKIAKLSYAPTLYASGLYNWLSMNNDFRFKNYKWDPYSTVGLTLSIPLIQGGSRYFRIKQAEIDVKSLKYQREDIVRNLTLQVRNSMDNIQKSIKQIASNKEGVRQAEKAYSIMQKSFMIGSATFIDLNDADLALTNSRLAYYQAIFDYLTAQSDLQLVLGNTDLNQYETNRKNNYYR